MSITISYPDMSGGSVVFADILASHPYTVLYFYPKDSTSGCTLEAQEFSALLDKFSGYGVQVIGVSKDGHTSHCSFIEKYGLRIPLISDGELLLHNQFAVIGEKSMYGKKYMGTIRSTFILDSSGTIVHKWINITAKGHAQIVLDYIINHIM